jgi:two-component system, OmpR family, response regulator
LAHRILIVDDEGHIREVIRVALKKAGMDVIEARDGKEALTRFAADRPDLIVLDIGMPEFDGLDVCREIRKTSDVPILFLSARDEEIDRILGLEIGGDDYVTKPFSPRELTARLQAAIRRTQRPANGSATAVQVSFGLVAADFSAMEFSRNGVPVALTANEIKLLRYFIEHADKVVTREELLNDVWGYTSYPTTRTVDNQVMKLRQKLEADPARPVHFRTMHGIGYKFVSGS